MSAEILPVVEIEIRRELAKCARDRIGGDVFVEVLQRIFEFEVGGYQIVARAGDLALPSEVALDAKRPEHTHCVGQLCEALLKQQIDAGARVSFVAGTSVAEWQLDRGIYGEDEFAAGQRDQDTFVGELEVARGGAFLLLLEALVAGENREARHGRDGFFKVD